jgi:SNF2 family DNA or RNA helicase
MPPVTPEVIEILDDEDTGSESEDNVSTASKSGRKRKHDAEIEEKVEWTGDEDDLPVKPKKRRGRQKSTRKKRGDDVHGENEAPKEDFELAGLPEYLVERRRKFDSKRKLHHDAALMVPPDYSGIQFEETRRLKELEERPKFSERSGIKPSRPYKDIELPQSAGLIPASIAQYLRDYQVAGVSFLHRKFVYQEGGILGDDMGLGKTVQVAAFLTVAFGKTGDERDAKRLRQIRQYPDRWYPRILIICPGSLIMNWKNELKRWGWWHTDLFHGSHKEDALSTARAGRLEIMITTYDTYKNSRSSINMVQWDAVVADECHRLKDRYSETTKALNEINALCRIGLTGTAIQNRYEELWTLLDWTNPGHFGTLPEWTQRVTKPLTVGQSHDATVAQLSLARTTADKLVHNLLPQYFLRRMKTIIAKQLPKKTDRVVFCPLTDLQRDAYENFLESADIDTLRSLSEPCCGDKKRGWCCDRLLSSGTRWQNIVFPSMMVLQKLANHLTLLVPQTTDLETKHESDLNTLRTCLPDAWKYVYDNRDRIKNLVNPEFCGKWKVLKKLLKFWHSNGDKVLVFSHSVRLLRILQHLFTNTSYSVSYLDGSLSYEQRQEVVDTFNSDPTQFVFLISTKAGGVGLNITSANKVVIIDPHWNPSYDLQAQDRAYRIGQTRDVEVFRLISLGTVEEIVYARQIYKQQQANIGYTASSERRYFKGVQQDTDRKGEIFGLANIFTYHNDSGLLQDIVNKTNIAEAKAGVHLVDVDMEKAARDGEDLGIVKNEEPDAEDGGMSQLATLLTAENQQRMLDSKKANKPKSDAIQAILTSAGVEYTHDNSEVIGTSKIEEQLSRRAAMVSYSSGDIAGQSALFAEGDDGRGDGLHAMYNPPEEVMLRHFCEMAKEFGFANATDFALVVESWTQEARRNCLDTFYKRREAKLIREGIIKEEDVKDAAKVEATNTEAKTEAKNEVKDEKMEVKPAIKDEAIKMDDTKETVLKTENTKTETTDTKMEGEKKVKTEVEGSSMRTSIFLSDDDDDDEL